MGGNKDDVKETPQQRAMTEYAVNKFGDWKQRWLPVQNNLIGQIQAMGKPDSSVRKAAAGRAATDTSMAFAKGQQGLQKTLTASGAGPGSAKFNLAVTGAGEDQAKSRAMGLTLADQQVDDAYVEGLGTLVKLGRGERAQVGDALSRMASSSARQAATDAEISAMERASTAQLVGQAAGFGLSRTLGPSTPSGPVGSVPGGYVAPDGQQFNNPSAFTPG
jgi:hypothetical protein